MDQIGYMNSHNYNIFNVNSLLVFCFLTAVCVSFIFQELECHIICIDVFLRQNLLQWNPVDGFVGVVIHGAHILCQSHITRQLCGL